MTSISYASHRFPSVIIQHAVWLYLRFSLSYRDIEDLLAERGLDISYETIRRWVAKFGPLFARVLRPQAASAWLLFCFRISAGSFSGFVGKPHGGGAHYACFTHCGL
jgi:hypothetical protein